MIDWSSFEREVIGKPFSWNGRGPEAYDCWGLVRAGLTYAGLLNFLDDWWIADGQRTTHPTQIMSQQETSGRWILVSTPAPGDVIAMSSHKRIHHIGLMVPGGVLHALPGPGVMRSSLPALLAQGYQRIDAYRLGDA